MNGPAHVDASSVRAIKPDTKYSLNIVFSRGSIYARAIIKMADKMCTDKAGNQLFTRSNGSMLIVHLGKDIRIEESLVVKYVKWFLQ